MKPTRKTNDQHEYFMTNDSKSYAAFFWKIFKISKFISFFKPVIEKVQWLENHADPWPQVKQFWEETFDARQLVLNDPEVTSEDYLKSYAGLRVARGSELVSEIVE